jgi:hypothetical protein
MATRKGVNAGAGVGVGASSGGTAASPDRKSGKSSVSFNDYHASWSALATTKKKAAVVTPTNAPPRAPTNDTDTRPHRESSARNDTIIEKMKCGTAERCTAKPPPLLCFLPSAYKQSHTRGGEEERGVGMQLDY